MYSYWETVKISIDGTVLWLHLYGALSAKSERMCCVEKTAFHLSVNQHVASSV